MRNLRERKMMSSDRSSTASECEKIVEVGKDRDSNEDFTSETNTDLDEMTLSVARRMNLSQVIARNSLIWARDLLGKLPIRLTLGNMGFVTVVMAVFMPRAFTYILVYPIFRLVFGTLYPAYASYKAVRTKNVKEYVSNNLSIIYLNSGITMGFET